MFPPSVPRFCVAMLPVSRAAVHSSGNSACSTGCFWISVYVVSAPRVTTSSRDFDAAQIRQLRQAQKSLVRKFSGLEQHHQVGAAGERLPDSWLASEQTQRFREASRDAQIVSGNVGSHRLPGALFSFVDSQARTTAAKIF